MVVSVPTPWNLHQEVQQTKDEVSISVLICTYSPDEEIFSRVLKSVENLTIPVGIEIECIIIDNNSPTSVENLSCVRDFLTCCPWARVIQEHKQGLTFARIAGFNAAKNSCIIFVDDDNQVSATYIQVLKDLFTNYPFVGAWGPGNVSVEFMGDVSDWFSENFKSVFQEKHTKSIEYGCVPETWTSFYPIGTGLAIRKEILAKYRDEVENGNLSSADRQGKALSSGGDIQIVWEGIKMGYAAGTAPDLSVKHLIPASRSNIDYVKRLNFGTAASALPCLSSSFPTARELDGDLAPSGISIAQTIIKITIRYWLKSKLNLLVTDLASYLGSVYGRYQVLQKSDPILDLAIARLKLK